jgi:hypothetical protein
MSTVTGQVSEIPTRIINTKYGEKPVYDIVVDGTKYGHGFTKPVVDVGDYVSFTSKLNQRGYPDVDGAVQKVDPPVGGSAAPVASGGFVDRQATISFNGAMNTAVSMVNAGVANGLLELPKGKADIWDAYRKYVFETCEELYLMYTQVTTTPEYPMDAIDPESPLDEVPL